MAETLLSAGDCTEILQNYYNDSTRKYVSYKILPLSENVEGFMGEHYILHITFQKDGKEDILKLFIKTKPVKNKAQADMVNQSPLYTKEIQMYELFNEFDKYGYDTSFAAKSYYNIPNQTLILDDLSTQNFEIHPRSKFTLEEIKCVLKSLAMYHAAGFAYERTKTKETGKKYQFDQAYPQIFGELFFSLYIKEESEQATRFWNNNFLMLNKLIDELPKDANYKEEFKSLIKEAKFCSTFVEEINLPKTCGHGDLWSNNMLLKYHKKTPIECRLVDFQIIRYNCPCIDVILGIFSNTSAELRSQHLQELYQFYYDTLSDILLKYGYKISEVMTLEDYHNSIEIFKHEVLFQVTVVNAIVCIPKEFLNQCVKKNDDSFDKILMENEDICLEAFRNDTNFNKVMSESLFDLYDALVDKKKLSV